MRDVFTMGARPIALLNSIHFGSPDHYKTKSLLNGVVSGIGGYGNCIGIPTVAGETKFNNTYNENILVNAMAVGLANKKKIFYSKMETNLKYKVFKILSCAHARYGQRISVDSVWFHMKVYFFLLCCPNVVKTSLYWHYA